MSYGRGSIAGCVVPGLVERAWKAGRRGVSSPAEAGTTYTWGRAELGQSVLPIWPVVI